MINKKDIKLEKGKVTLLYGERGCGISTSLCNVMDEYLESGKRVLLISCNYNCAIHTSKMLKCVYLDNQLDVINEASLESKLVGNRYDLVVYDTPNLNEVDVDLLFLKIKKCCSDNIVIIGLTWEDILEDSEISLKVDEFINNSDYCHEVEYLDIIKDDLYMPHWKDAEKLKRDLFYVEIDKISDIQPWMIKGVKFPNRDKILLSVVDYKDYEINMLVNTIKDGKDLDICLLDRVGCVVRTWRFKDVRFMGVDLGELNYEDSSLFTYEIILHYKGKELVKSE